MCNFVPGEVLVLGKSSRLRDAKHAIAGGSAEIVELFDEGTQPPEELGQFAMLRVQGVSPGYEVMMVSEISALLSEGVRKREVFVELNAYLPMASTEGDTLRFSQRTRQWVTALSRVERRSSAAERRPVAFIDSGVNVPSLNSVRPIVAYDYTGNGAPIARTDDHDQRGHGTRVARLLDETLEPETRLISAKIANDGAAVTLLSLCRVFGDVVARERPAVINLSLAPFDDTTVCRHCKKLTSVRAFQSQILSRLFRLAFPTITVMAAGNAGQRSNFGRFLDLGSPVILVAALGSDGAVTRYTNMPSGGLLAREVVAAFGGDDEDVKDGAGVFEDRTSVGTSFAAPLVTSLVHRRYPQLDPNTEMDDELDTIRDLVRRFAERAWWRGLGPYPW